MNSEQNELDVVELGVASEETRGPNGARVEIGGLDHQSGIADLD